MKRALFFSIFAVLFVIKTAEAQIGDGCHVYIVDVAAAKKANTMGTKCDDESKCGVTTFTEFKPEVGEEELTTKTYPFPKSNFKITANVFFTDESLASANHRDSVLLGITVAPKPLKGVLADENSAVAEFSLGDKPDAIRVKRYYRIRQKSYLVGLECHFQPLQP